MTQDDSHFRLRLPTDLKLRVEKAAKDSGRSINAQVIACIEAALNQQNEIDDLRMQISVQAGRTDALRDTVRIMQAQILNVMQINGMRDFLENENH
jgi:hypothetical protein